MENKDTNGYHSGTDLYNTSSGSEDDDPEFRINEELPIDPCKACKDAELDYGDAGNTTTLHIDAMIMSVTDKSEETKEKQKKRYKLRDRILKYICGIRNKGDGMLILHVENQGNDNWYKGWLDQQIDPGLNRLIEDGDLFRNVYKKVWLPLDGNETIHSGFLAITVTGATLLTTLHYNTYFQTDQGVQEMQSNNMIHFFKQKRILSVPVPDNNNKDNAHVPVLKGKPGKNVYESCEIQFKHFEKHEETTAGKLMKNLWSPKHSHVRKYISAFAKNAEGGSFYFGIRENVHENKADIICSGFRFKNNQSTSGIEMEGHSEQTGYNNFLKKLEGKLHELRIFNYEGKRILNPTIWEINIFAANNAGNWILEVATCAVLGIVFTEKPECYRLEGGKLLEYGEKTWIKEFCQRLQLL